MTQSHYNVFVNQPEFIEMDPRRNRPFSLSHGGHAYPVAKDFMYTRHQIMAPADSLKDKTVLDVGSCLGASGAWALSNGAKLYTGIEPQTSFVTTSRQILSKYYDEASFNIEQCSIDDFNSDIKYDIVLANGVIYGTLDTFAFVRKLISLANETIIIESQHPFDALRRLITKADDETRKMRLREIDMIQILEDKYMMIDADSETNIMCTGCLPSVTALSVIFKHYGWSYDSEPYLEAERLLPSYYDPANPNGRRYISRFYKSGVTSPTFPEIFNKPEAKRAPWHGDSMSE